MFSRHTNLRLLIIASCRKAEPFVKKFSIINRPNQLRNGFISNQKADLFQASNKGTMASNRDGKTVQQWVDDCITSQPVVVFSKTYCPFCDMAKDALSQAGIADYLLIELENREDCGEVQDYLQNRTGGRTVPRVFIQGNFVGGGTEVRQLQDQGKLAAMVSKL